jgi:hypothetical protein
VAQSTALASATGFKKGQSDAKDAIANGDVSQHPAYKSAYNAAFKKQLAIAGHLAGRAAAAEVVEKCR